jgi:hypothetical protein
MRNRTVFIITADLVRTNSRERVLVSHAFHRNKRLRTPGFLEQDEVDREFDLRAALLELVDLHLPYGSFRLRNAALIMKRGPRLRSVDPAESYWTREFFGRTFDHEWRYPGLSST